MPTGTVPPFVMRFDTDSVPVGCRVFSSETRTIAEIQDLALMKVRPLFSALAKVFASPPFGGSERSTDAVELSCGCSETLTITLREPLVNYTLFGPAVQIYTATHPMNAELRRKQEFSKPIEIGSDVWVGGGAVICPGVKTRVAIECSFKE